MAKTKTPTEPEANLSHIDPALRHLAVPIKELQPDTNNARAHDEANVAAIAESLRTFGQDQPVVVQREGMIVRKGNGRLLAAYRLGWTHIAALVIDEAAAKAKARAIADNRTAELATWDERVLAKLLEELKADPVVQVTVTGFTDEQIAKVIEKGKESGVLDGMNGPGGPPSEGGGEASTENIYAGYKSFQCMFTTDQELRVREAIKLGKSRFEVETAADALAAICKGYLDANRT